MTSRASSKFWSLYHALPERIRDKADTAYDLFSQNPSHPSLQFKKVHATLPVYSARIDLNYRAVGVINGDAIVWFWIGTHDAYEKLLASF